MTPPLTIHYKRDTFKRQFQFLDSLNNPIDITGWVLTFTLKTNKIDSDPGILQKVVNVHTDPIKWKTTLICSSSEMNIDVKDFFYDYQVKNSDNEVTTIESGIFRIVQDITTTS